MRNLIMGGLVATVALAAAPASATVVTFAPGVYTVPAYATSTTTRNFESAPLGAYSPGAGEATTNNVIVAQGSVPGQTADTDTNPNNKYLSIEQGTYSLTFGSGIQFFSFVAGTIDTYNTLTLNFVGGSSLVLAGAQITTGMTSTAVNAFATNSAGNSQTSGRVTYDFQGGAGLLSATFGTTQAAFEIDDIVTAVPEPAAWALMILGFGVVGGQLRSRRRRTTVAFAV
jgi:hypothetical protein